MISVVIKGLLGIAPKIRKPESFIILASRAGNCSLQKGVIKMLTHEEKKNLIAKHNQNVLEALHKAEKGEIINLTELVAQLDYLVYKFQF